MSDASGLLSYLARNFPQWEISRDREGWHAIPSARLVFSCYLRGQDVPDLHRETLAGLLILLEAWRARSADGSPRAP